jgi:ketosteroid isomerase-like protein
MGLLFRPRRPVMRLAADAAGSAASDAARDAQLADRLRRAVEVSVTGDPDGLAELYTDDVRGSSPTLTVSSLAELTAELAGRRGAFSELEVAAEVGVSDDRGYAEWVVCGCHTGPLVVDEAIVVPPGGNRVTIRGVTVAEFTGDKISSFRQYWDELALLEGLGLIPLD